MICQTVKTGTECMFMKKSGQGPLKFKDKQG